jgi:1,4-dihydroxy-2-naphthoate octaprenyltransferase
MSNASLRLDLHTFKNIILLGRPRFLPISLSLYTMGSLLALISGVGFDAWRFLFGYLILFLGHLSVHYSNDHFDFEADRPNHSSATSGGSGILAKNPELLEFSGWFGLSLAVLSVIGAAVFTAAYSFPLLYLAMAVLGNLISWYYTAPPVRLAYKDWGVLASAFSVGLIMPLFGDFSTVGRITPLFLAFTIPLFLQALSFLIAVQIPDMESDRLANKRTFVAEHGQSWGFFMVLLPLAAATSYYIAAPYLVPTMAGLKLMSIISLLPLGMAAYSFIKRSSSKEKVIRLVKYNVICFVAFTLMSDLYFAFVFFH